MDIYKELSLLESYDMWLVIIGFSALIITALPRLLSDYPFSMSIVLLLVGFGAVSLPLGLEAPNPFEQGTLVEQLTELGIILSFMGAGLRIDRPLKFKAWRSTFRLLIITMPLSIIMVALAGGWFAALAPATAILLGAVMSTTDPVLASEVQITSPEEDEKRVKNYVEDDFEFEKENELRFSLTTEAGFNSGLIFPFTYLALAMAMAGNHPSNWFADWLIIDIFYKFSVGITIGIGMGYVLARTLLSLPSKTELAKTLAGIGGLAAALLIFGVTELIGGYSFIAVFLGSLTIRNYKKNHGYHESLYQFSEKAARIVLGVILVLLGAAIADGLLKPLTPALIFIAFLTVFVIRPAAGAIAFIGFNDISWPERLAISFFGVRGIALMFYLSHALNMYNFPKSEELWAVVALVIVISSFVHGTLATPVTNYLDKIRD